MGWLSKLLGGTKVQPVSLNDDNYEEEVLNSDLPVLVDVWTPTCTHCHKLEPIIMDLAKTFDGRLKVAEVNGAAAPRTMARLGVRGGSDLLHDDDGVRDLCRRSPGENHPDDRSDAGRGCCAPDGSQQGLGGAAQRPA